MRPSKYQDAFVSGRAGIVVVDHGSRRSASNEGLLEVVQRFREATGYRIVEPAHMELAEPSIATAFGRVVDAGAELVIVHPYFLLPGRHWEQDIPQLVSSAAAGYPGIQYLVTAPLGVHPLMHDIMLDRIDYCLSHVWGEVAECDVCRGTSRCGLRSWEDRSELEE